MDQLTTLSLRGDATVQEYMARLRVRQGVQLHQPKSLPLLFQSWGRLSEPLQEQPSCNRRGQLGPMVLATCRTLSANPQVSSTAAVLGLHMAGGPADGLLEAPSALAKTGLLAVCQAAQS